MKQIATLTVISSALLALLVWATPSSARFTAQTIVPDMWIPAAPEASGSGPAFGNNTIDAAAEKFATIIRAPRTGTLCRFGVRQSTNTNTPDNGIRFSFQDLSGTDADGTQDQFADVTSGFGAGAWLEPTGCLTSDGTGSGSKRSVTAGDLVALVVEYVSFTAGDNISISSVTQPGDPQEQAFGGFPYTRHFTAAWANCSSQCIGVVGLRYDDNTYAYVGTNAQPYAAFNTATFNSGSTPDERGMIFQLPIEVTVSGAWFRADIDNALDFVLYDNASSALVTIAHSSSVRTSTDNATFIVFFAPQTVPANTNFRAVIKPGASNVSLLDFDVNTAAHMDSFGGGQNFHYTERTDGGAWTQTTTKRPFMGLLISSIENDATPNQEHSHVFGFLRPLVPMRIWPEAPMQ